MFQKLALIFISLFLLGNTVSYSEGEINNDEGDDSYVITLYNDRNGLPTSEANTILESKDGYIWIGSYGGLIRYDGTTFTNYSDNEVFPSSAVRSLLQDDEGRLWIGTNDMGLFYYENGEFMHIESEYFTCVRDIEKTNDGRIVISGYDGVAYVEDGRLDIITDEHVYGKTVYSMGVDVHGNLWLSMDEGITVINGRTFTRFYDSSFFFDHSYTYCVASDKDGHIYVGSTGEGICVLTISGLSVSRRVIKTDIGTHNNINVTDDGTILVCGYNGLAVIDKNDRVRTFSGEDARGENYAIKDANGNIWLAGSYGVVKYVKSVFDVPKSSDGILEETAVNSICKVNEDIYLSTNTGLLVYDENYEPVNNKATEYLEDRRIRDLTFDGKKVYFACDNIGLVSYDINSGEIRNYTTEDGLLSNSCRTLLLLSTGELAVGLSNGVCILSEGEIVRKYGEDEGMSNTLVLCLLEKDKGGLLVGSDGKGLYEINYDDVIHYGSEENLNDGIIMRMAKDTEGNIYVSAGNSLYLWQGDSFRKLNNFEKRAGSIFDIRVTDSRIYLLQNSGIIELDRRALLKGENVPAVFYTFAQGLSGSIAANTKSYADDEGRLYIPTVNGISVFNFKKARTPLPAGVINFVSVDDKTVFNPTEIVLDKDAQRINISFAALNFSNNSNCEVAYQIVGFDENEFVLDEKYSHSVTYTNLPGGEYTFRLRIYSLDDSREEYVYELPIIKEYKLTERPVFWVFVTMGGILAVTLIVSALYRARIKKEQERKEQYHSIVEDSLKTFANAIDAKDPYTNGHSNRVALYSKEIARRLGMNEEQQENIYYKAMLHDMGKIGVPDAVLKKTAKLDPEERRQIEEHVDIGGRILSNFRALPGIADGARFHHEKYDGSGYTQHLQGDDIPYEARIIAIADTYDAMSTDRCYRKALPSDVCIAELEKNAGKQFDPKLVPYMIEMIKEGFAPIILEDKKDAAAPEEEKEK